MSVPLLPDCQSNLIVALSSDKHASVSQRQKFAAHGLFILQKGMFKSIPLVFFHAKETDLI
jgi:hypothetical protein